jgi:hypothetical protein
MARGVYLMIGDLVVVEFGSITAVMSKWRYEESGIQPPFSELSLPREYFQANGEATKRPQVRPRNDDAAT